MMQPSILGPALSSAPAPGGPNTSSHSSASSAAATAGFLPERHPSFARRSINRVPTTTTTHTTTAPSNRNITTAPSSHNYSHNVPTRSAGSDFIHVDRSNNRRMAAASTSDRVDSWIEVGSQPSDSYTSSSPDEAAVITSGLHLNKRKARRRRNSTSTAIPSASKSIEFESSSEYDEDDEDIDGIDLNTLDSIGSSITDPSLSEGEEGSSEEDEDDEGEIQPLPTYHYSSNNARPQNFRTFSRDPPQPDHDAALRASLSTLLSCAAGVGNASKPRGNERLGIVQEMSRPAPIQTLSLVTDSEREAIMAVPQATMPPQQQQFRKATQQPAPQEHQQPVRQASPRRTKEDSHSAKHKAKTRSRRPSKATTASTSSTLVTPSNITYLTLAVSAGAVILVSAISFSAGYALGKEVGRTEMLELGTSGGEIVKRAASGTVSKVGGRIVMSTGVGSGLRSITVA